MVDIIKTNAEGPAKASGDSGSVEQHKLPDQIAADKYLESKKASRAKELARRVICCTRMNGISKAAHLYAAENDGFWPMSDNDTNTNDYNRGVAGPPNPLPPSNWTYWHMAWTVALDRYLGLRPKKPQDFATPFAWQDAVESAEVKQCPVWSGYPEEIKYNPKEYGAPTAHWSIGMNGFFHRGDEFNGIPNPGYSMGHQSPGNLKLTRSEELKHPAETVAFADKIAHDTGHDSDYSTRSVVREEHVAARHLGVANAGFCDGHAESCQVKTKTYQDNLTPTVSYETWYPEVDNWDETTYTVQERNEEQPYIWNFNRPENQ